MLHISMSVLHRTWVIKSRRCLSVKMKELMGSFCCSCVESVNFGYPQHLWNSGHLDWKIFFFYGLLQKHLHTWLLHLLAAFIVHSCHCGCTCLAPVTSHALRKENLLARKDSECTSDLPAPSPSPAWQSKTISSKSSKVKQNVTFHHQSWGILCGECYLWPFTPYHSCIHLSIIL